MIFIAQKEDEEYRTTVSGVFYSIFFQRIDLIGIDTLEGNNIKRFGVFNKNYGIFKKRIAPIITDLESEITVFLLAKKLGVNCCPVYRIDKDTIFCQFLYQFSKEFIVHFANLTSENTYQSLISTSRQFKDEIAKMFLLDFITKQEDRHLANFAIKVIEEKEMFYPLYDNGRSLFYQDSQEMVETAFPTNSHLFE